MLAITMNLLCDGCKRGFPVGDDTYFDSLFQIQISQVREKARKKGWRRYRLKNTLPNGDYCPKCQAAQRRAAEAKTK